ncbi:signal peptidase complex-like protein DTM1 [Beta vulgaris subsp. vulgaris]|uniref:signal peptidase complex-like protein DTM1 n=1 Tax=Beta vulgaris subsp. vulgaris TaxID=3555 RepID=UPI00053F5DEA|nr:signal peptidase complex-like protein DTM1 [Beta vulgaris subsp. vulgaris]
MGDDVALRRCLVWLAMVVIIVGFYTHSFKKMVVTYFMGLAGIGGVLLPDWDFFDRDFSEWTQPVSVDEIKRSDVLRLGSTRFRFYPLRTVIYAVVYGFGLYKWWTYVRQ